MITTVVTAIGALLAGGGGATIINAFARRKVVHVDAATALNDQALQFVKSVEQSAQEARRSAGEAWAQADLARREASEARREAGDARREAAEIGRELRALRTVILDPLALSEPGFTIERLRTMVGREALNL